MRTCFVVCLFVLFQILVTVPAYSHCEIPCGIYNDEMRCNMIAEHITTVEKSMQMIISLSKEENTNYNQLVRWVMNKETHAAYIQDIVQQYFLTQRIKPANEGSSSEKELYLKKLTLLHGLLLHAMKAKQTTDLDQVEKLRSLLEQFKAVYFGPEGSGH